MLKCRKYTKISQLRIAFSNEEVIFKIWTQSMVQICVVWHTQNIHAESLQNILVFSC